MNSFLKRKSPENSMLSNTIFSENRQQNIKSLFRESYERGSKDGSTMPANMNLENISIKRHKRNATLGDSFNGTTELNKSLNFTFERIQEDTNVQNSVEKVKNTFTHTLPTITTTLVNNRPMVNSTIGSSQPVDYPFADQAMLDKINIIENTTLQNTAVLQSKSLNSTKHEMHKGENVYESDVSLHHVNSNLKPQYIIHHQYQASGQQTQHPFKISPAQA